MTLTIDASSIVSGGGLTHLIELTNHINDPSVTINVIASEKVLEKLDNKLLKKSHPFLNKTIFHRIIFQFFLIDKFLKESDVLLSVTGDYIGNFKPVIGISQNMLLYERENLKGFGLEKIKFVLNYYRQKISFKNSDGIIFLSNYSKQTILEKLNLKTKKFAVINHGVNIKFQSYNSGDQLNRFDILYVSSFHYYKNQIEIIKALHMLRKKYPKIKLTLVGNFISNSYKKKLLETINKLNEDKWIFLEQNIGYEKINGFYSKAGMIVFASSCENMPLILIESMKARKPILCSNRKPMTEFLSKENFFFDPKNINSIHDSFLTAFTTNENKLINISNQNFKDSNKFNWEKTSIETVSFLKKISKSV